MEKRTLNMAELEAQTVLELPDRDMMALLTIVIGNVDVDIIRDVTITIENNNVEVLNRLLVNICAAVLSNNAGLTCTATIS